MPAGTAGIPSAAPVGGASGTPAPSAGLPNALKPPASPGTTALGSAINGLNPAATAAAGKNVAQSEEDLGQAKATQAVQDAQSKGQFAEQQAQAAQGIYNKYEPQIEATQPPPFVPSTDNAIDLAGLFGMISVMGTMLGKANGGHQAALGAMNAMTGMMAGWQQGRADLYEKERQNFDENLKVLQEKNKNLQEAMKRAMDMLPYDNAKAEAAMQIAVAQHGGPVLLQEAKTKGAQAAYNTLKDVNAVTEKIEDYRLKQEELGLKAEDLEYKRTQGARGSAVSMRFADNILRSSGEALRSVNLANKIGITQSGGAFGSVVTGGSISSGATAALANNMTEDDQKLYNTNLSGIGLELANVLGGGYRINKTMVDKIEEAAKVKPGDSYLVAAYKYASVVAKLKVGLEESTWYTPGQQARAQALLKQIGNYPTPEQILDKLGKKRISSDEVAARAKKYGRDPDEIKSTLEDQGYVVVDQMPDITASDIILPTQSEPAPLQ
jgi:hypothetical protein